MFLVHIPFVCIHKLPLLLRPHLFSSHRLYLPSCTLLLDKDILKPPSHFYRTLSNKFFHYSYNHYLDINKSPPPILRLWSKSHLWLSTLTLWTPGTCIPPIRYHLFLPAYKSYLCLSIQRKNILQLWNLLWLPLHRLDLKQGTAILLCLTHNHMFLSRLRRSQSLRIQVMFLIHTLDIRFSIHKSHFQIPLTPIISKLLLSQACKPASIHRFQYLVRQLFLNSRLNLQMLYIRQPHPQLFLK